MKIADSLRQECMPDMVYSICKMTLIEKDRDRIQQAITLGNNDKETQEQFNKVFRFACDCEFIKEDKGTGSVECMLDENRLNTFSQFRMQVANNIFKNKNSKFVKISEWYLGKEDGYIFSQDTGEALSAYINDELKMDVDKFYALGFRFWMVALGFLSFQNYRRSAVMFSCQNYLMQWINEKKFIQNKFFPVREFMDELTLDCPVFETMIRNNHLNLAFSMAMRVLKGTGYIDARRVKDSGDVWHIRDSVLDPWILSDSDSESRYRNEFSELMIKR